MNNNIDEKLDMILQEMISFRKKLEEKSGKLSSLEASFNDRLSCLEASFNDRLSCLEASFNDRLSCLEASFNDRLSCLEANNEEAHKKIFENLDRIDRRITSIKSDNTEEHRAITRHLDSLNSAFIRYETDGIDKIKALFDSDKDRKNHQDIYGHEFKRLNELVAKNSFRISNLEKHFQ